jgi:hypothetical protein
MPLKAPPPGLGAVSPADLLWAGESDARKAVQFFVLVHYITSYHKLIFLSIHTLNAKRPLKNAPDSRLESEEPSWYAYAVTEIFSRTNSLIISVGDLWSASALERIYPAES